MTVDIVYPGIAMRDTKFPKLRTEPASYYLNIALQAKNYTFANPRFAFEFYLMNPGKEGFVTTKSRFIDDQYTPGENIRSMIISFINQIIFQVVSMFGN